MFCGVLIKFDCGYVKTALTWEFAMNLTITSHHLTVTDALRHTVEEKLAKPLRHFDKIQSIQVILSRDNNHSDPTHGGKNAHNAEAILRVSGQEMFVKASGDDMYAVIGEMADMLTRQVRKHKTRLEKRTPHHDKRRAAEYFSAQDVMDEQDETVAWGLFAHLKVFDC